MGYYGRLEDKIKAQELRKRGYSYKEIIKLIPASKDTISRWCRDIKLTKKQLSNLYKKQRNGGIKGSIIGAKKQQNNRIIITKKLLEDGVNEISELNKREKLLIGAALYAAEGTKKDRRCEFANSDPKIIKFMIDWFRNNCIIPENKLRGAIWLHEGLSESKAKKYWSNLTKIPINQFHKTYITINKTNSLKVRKNLHQYGIFSIKFYDAKIHRKIMGWIAGILR